jgi:hypothetical protein
MYKTGGCFYGCGRGVLGLLLELLTAWSCQKLKSLECIFEACGVAVSQAIVEEEKKDIDTEKEKERERYRYILLYWCSRKRTFKIPEKGSEGELQGHYS